MKKHKILVLLFVFTFVFCGKKKEDVAVKSNQKQVTENYGECQLKEAIKLNEKDFTSFIDSSKNINKFYQFDEYSSYTLLGYCCKLGRYDLVKKLIEKKADLAEGKEDEYYGYDALWVAIENQNEKIVDLLLENKAKVNNLYTESGITALSLACKYPNFKIIQALINHKADVNGNYYPKTEMASIPILEATRSKNKEAVKFLLQNGANINQVDLEGISALSYAKENEKEIYNELFRSPKLKNIAPIAEKFHGSFTAGVDGELTTQGTGHTTYDFTISKNKIELKSISYRGDFLCEGDYAGIESNNILEIYYIGNDDRCLNLKPNYLIKIEEDKYFIKGIGGEGTINEWIKLEKK